MHQAFTTQRVPASSSRDPLPPEDVRRLQREQGALLQQISETAATGDLDRVLILADDLRHLLGEDGR